MWESVRELKEKLGMTPNGTIVFKWESVRELKVCWWASICYCNCCENPLGNWKFINLAKLSPSISTFSENPLGNWKNNDACTRSYSITAVWESVRELKEHSVHTYLSRNGGENPLGNWKLLTIIHFWIAIAAVSENPLGNWKLYSIYHFHSFHYSENPLGNWKIFPATRASSSMLRCENPLGNWKWFIKYRLHS